MTRLPAVLSLLLACTALPAQADDLIRKANSQESLVLGISHLREQFQSLDSAKAVVPNALSGYELDLGWADTRMRTLLGRPNVYTRMQVMLGLSQQDFRGDPVDPVSGQPRRSDGPFTSEYESMGMRAGYTFQFGPSARFALTPYAGLAQHASVRGSSSIAGSGIYADFTGSVGLLAQMALTRQVVLGADASIGHTLGAWEVDRHDVVGPTAVPSSFELFVDNRTFTDWHQRYILRYGDTRFGGIEQSIGSLQTQRRTAWSVVLEFGTEGRLWEELFH